jgi:hypothetical protein
MRWTQLFLLIILFQFSCFSIRESGKSTYLQSAESEELDSLSNYLIPTHYNLYSIDFEKFDISIFEGKSEMELALNGIPFKAEEQRKYLFSQFLKRVNKAISHVPNYSEERIIELFGRPTINYPRYLGDGELIVLEYKLNSGFKCPDCNVSFHRIFENCDYIRFQFKNGKLVQMNFDIYYSGLND